LVRRPVPVASHGPALAGALSVVHWRCVVGFEQYRRQIRNHHLLNQGNCSV